MSAISALIGKNKHHLLNLGRILRNQSSFKVVFVLCFVIAFETGLWALFLDGFKFLYQLGGAGLLVISRLFALSFLGMGIMLVVSSIVTSYSTVFRSEEIAFLIVRPFQISEIVSYKFIQSTGLSSWAFFFIIIPFVGAYAWHERMSPLFALWTFLFSVPFLLLCSGIGTIVTMLFVRWFPRGRLLRICGMLFIIALFVFFWRFSCQIQILTGEATFNLSRLVPGLRLASNALAPSWWISEGILALAHNQWIRGVMLWGVLLSSAMLIYVAVEWLGQLIFYEGWQRVAGGSTSRSHSSVLLRRLDRCLSFLAHDTRALIMKDIRIFLRDPMQWSQVLIFFGFLALYFANLRTFRYHVRQDSWRSIIAFLNVFSVSAVMCSLGSRFVYPQLSLEGQGFWIVGLSPTTTTKVIMTKFVMALVGMLAISVSLMLLSAGMLNAARSAKIAAVALVCAVSFAVCGLSTGLGAIFLDLDQRNPAAIVSGFGGTLNFVLSLAFMLAAIFPFGFVFHLHFIQKINLSQLHQGLLLSGVWLFVITVAATVIPLWLGNKSLQSREF